ncbi:hypothetical protein ACFV9W_13960 [Streptomyces sp. NPDC059897]|uniref:hypothetical protein n=1 Tax=Streptomyces sp. NPDC059897 TaxID=3346994 RepID=UPI003663871C
MSITPQMGQGQQGQQQFPSTSPHQQQGMGQQQPFGQQQFGQEQLQQQLQNLGQQQPYQQLLQQLGGQQQGYGQQQQQYGQQQDQQAQQMEQQAQQQLRQVQMAAIQQSLQQVEQQALASGIANGYIDIVQPLPGQPRQIFLRINNVFRVLNNPTPQAHDEIQEAFAFGHQVVGVWDTGSPNILRSVRVQRV